MCLNIFITDFGQYKTNLIYYDFRIYLYQMTKANKLLKFTERLILSSRNKQRASTTENRTQTDMA